MYEIFQKYLEEKAELTPAESERIQSFAISKKLRKKQYLLQEGDVWNTMLLLLRAVYERIQLTKKEVNM